MRGLPFPSSAQYDREASYDYGSPLNVATTIPIDPALGGPLIDPAIMREAEALVPVPKKIRRGKSHKTVKHIPVDVPFYPHHLRESTQVVHEPSHHHQKPTHYSQGPQGDPFAPPLPPVFLPIEQPEPPRTTPKPPKRKRRPKREEECGFCHGDGIRGENGRPEALMTCSECGRSGHRSCLQLGDVGDLILAYIDTWKCVGCKDCEICHEKGDEERILFCDSCDRGWHMDCLEPPIAEPPTGKWHCPICPPLDPALEPPPTELDSEAMPAQPDEENASAAYSPISSKMQKGKVTVVSSDESETDVVDTIQPKARRGRKKKRKSNEGDMNVDEGQGDEVPPPQHKKMQRLRGQSPAQVSYPPVKIRLRIPGKGKARERQEEEDKRGVFDDILPPGDRDTTKTMVESTDKLRFNKSRIAAETKVVTLNLPRPSASLDTPETPGPSSRPLRSVVLSHLPISTPTPATELSTSPAPSTPGPHQPASAQPHTLRIRTIRFGQFDIQTWYDAPFPEEYATIPDGRLWICEFCLKYMKSRFGAGRHRMKCKSRHPPGDEIYRDGSISIFEVDGRKNKIYCQNLCLLSKMFLDHKSLFYDVEPFLFYVMTEVDETGARFVGYFSKEKRSPKDYNVSCIMTLPVRQRQGWGNLLIDFSYLLSKKEGRVGSPEKPLSALGALGYRNYWTLSLMRYLETAPANPRLEDISAATSMTIEDVYSTLVHHSMLSVRETTPSIPKPSPGQSIKFPKGRKNGIARRHLQRTHTQTPKEDEPKSSKGPFVPPTEYEIHWEPEKVEMYLRNWEAKKYLKLKPEKLKWSPFLVARTKKTEAAEAARTADLATSTVGGQAADEVDALTSAIDRTTLANSIFSSDVDNSATPMERLDSESTRDAGTPTPAPQRRRGNNRARGGTSTPRSTRQSSSTRSMSMVQTMDADEALAAKLALEERMGSRQLRPRSRSGKEAMAGQVHEMSRASASVSRSASPRKKRRVVESPLEAEAAAPLPAVVENGLLEPETLEDDSLGSAINGSSACASASEALRRRSGRKASPLTLNGHDRDAARVNGRSHEDDMMRVSPSLPSGLDSPCPANHPEDDLVMAPSEFEDGKFDMDSPLTGLSSLHSVPPSEDTDSERPAHEEMEEMVLQDV